MIDRKQAEENGIVAIDGGGRLAANREALRDKLKALLPALVNSDGHVDAKALQDVVDVANSRSNNQGYELTFAGKGLARAMADSPTKYELKTELGQSKDFHNTGNVVIRGDNIDALKILYQNYFGKIKMIYIDPPYNTGSDDFIYKNDFKKSEADLIDQFGLDDDAANFLHNIYGTYSHSGWLAFMYPRIKIARDLMKDDGFIAITIDHYELNNLISISDEIFGKDNRLGIVTILHNPKGRNLASFFSENSEYMLVYAKNKAQAAFEKVAISQDVKKSFNLQDKHGKYRLDPFMRARKDATRKRKPDFFYPLYVSPDLKAITTEKKKGYTEVLPVNDRGVEYSWKVLKDTFQKRNKTGGFVAVPSEENNGKVFICNKYREQEVFKNVWGEEKHQSEREEESITAKDNLWDERKYQSEFYGTNIVKDLLGANIFSYPKSIHAVGDALKITTQKDDFILDFFAGSGTTGDAVMRLNAEDGGNRKFILVQWDEAIDKKKKESQAAYDFCVKNGFNPVISSITIERLNRAGEKIKAETKKQNITLLTEAKKPLPDIGYKVYSLAPNPTIAEREGKGNLQLGAQNKRKTPLDTLTNMLCATGKTLSAPTECVKKNTIYKTKDSLYVLGNVSAEDLQPYGDYDIYLDGWADINLIALLNIGFHDKSKKEKLKVVY